MKNRYLLCSFFILCLLFITSIVIFIAVDKFYSKSSSHANTDVSNVETFLAVVITTAGQNFKKRKAIRNSWLKLSPFNAKHVFVVGRKDAKYRESDLLQEMEKHQDMLLLSDTSDQYDSLTVKILRTFVHLNAFWKFRFALKCDDDSFVRLPDIVNELQSRFFNVKNLYWGFFSGNANVKRKGRWKETKWILCDRYLPYALGGGYVVSASLVQFIAQNHKFLNIFQTEDVSVGTWLAPVNVTRIHDPRFDTEYISRGCSNAYLITHKHDATNMNHFFNNIVNTGTLCHSEYKLRLSYLYNWDVEPSKCCIRRNSSIP